MQYMSSNFRQSFSNWLTTEGSDTSSIPLLIDSFCRFLTANGYAVHRCNLATDTIHPQMTGMRHVWYSEKTDPGSINPAVLVDRQQYQIGKAFIDEVFFNAGSQENPQYKASPFFVVEQKGELYERIKPIGQPQLFPVFEDLAQEGCTAYFGMLLKSFAGMRQKIGLASKCAGGLNKQQIDDLRWGISLMTLHVNTLIENSIKNTLARVYLGRDPGRRVSEGMISLGKVISLESAIWFSDLRDFTEISAELDAEELVQTLNQYFGNILGPIYAHKGEVLKLIGDAVLAIFPTSNFASPGDSCNAALQAAYAAEQNLSILNVEREAASLPALNHGIALHYGEARYGNIGTAERLDFTLIGHEVNIASRLEGLTKEVGKPLLCSQPFAETANVKMQDIGKFQLKGIAQPVRVFTPGTKLDIK